MPTKEAYEKNPEYYKERASSYAREHPERVAITRYKHSLQVREYLQTLKTETPCTDCGRHYSHYVMEFDHVNGERTHQGTRGRQTSSCVSSLVTQRW